MRNLGLRRATSADLVFVSDSWVDSFKHSHAAGVIPMNIYRKTYELVVTNIINRPGVEILVAFNPEGDGRDIYSWLCHERDAKILVKLVEHGRHEKNRVVDAGPVLHYAYTKEMYRRMGFFTALMGRAGISFDKPFFYTFKTGLWSTIARERAKGAQWDPSIARHPKDPKPTSPEESHDREG